jgi:hypothetical protein
MNYSLDYYLQQILCRKESVIVPGFGIFSNEILASRVVETNGSLKIYPSQRKVGFERNLLGNDSSLAIELSKTMNTGDMNHLDDVSLFIENDVESWLKELQNNQDPSSLPDYFQASDIVLPDSLSMRKISPAAPTAKPMRRVILKVKLNGDLAEAEWRAEPDLSPFRPQDVSRLRYLLGVAPNGRVALVVPLLASPEDRLIQTELGMALAKTRFKPRPTQIRQWGEVTFFWASADTDSP